MITYTCVPVGMLESNCYILNCDGALALIDCGVFSRSVREAVAAQGGDLRYILLTHGHFDHIQGVAAAKEAYPDAQVCIGEADGAYLTGEISALPGRPARRIGVVQPDRLLREGDEITLGESTLRVIDAPGHTPGGVCYWAEKERLLFTGDTLFFEEVGRADLPGGDWPVLQDTVRRLYEIPGDGRVLPGHYQASSLAHERRHNPYVTAQ